MICSINGSRLPDRRPARNRVVKGEPRTFESRECWILAMRERSAAVLSTENFESASSPALPSGSDGRKNGAFSGAFGGSLALFRS